ncbi:MAG: hypothetical protein UH850_09460 [Paludibacteraceae bacterium]|nr:hypothetical protein [Paludibacteraceae bacterium]
MKNSIKAMRYIGFILVLLTVLSSCDSREDWFAREDDGATFIIKSSKRYWWDEGDLYEFRNDTVDSDYYKLVEFNLKVNDVRCGKDYYGTPLMGYSSECLNFNIEGLIQKVTRNTFQGLHVSTQLLSPILVDNSERNVFYFIDSDGSSPMTRNDTIAPILNTAEVTMELKDAYQNKLYCYLRINCLGDIPPIPIMEVKDIDGYPMEKVLSLGKSYDKDGSVTKYEFCIDGNIRSYNLPVYDCDPEGLPAGKGAYGGTYITSTEISEVRHSFQSKGEHIVYYRCMDNLGLWSVWNNVTVTIK